jgi:hypothetical protein
MNHALVNHKKNENHNGNAGLLTCLFTPINFFSRNICAENSAISCKKEACGWSSFFESEDLEPFSAILVVSICCVSSVVACSAACPTRCWCCICMMRPDPHAMQSMHKRMNRCYTSLVYLWAFLADIEARTGKVRANFCYFEGGKEMCLRRSLHFTLTLCR